VDIPRARLSLLFGWTTQHAQSLLYGANLVHAINNFDLALFP